MEVLIQQYQFADRPQLIELLAILQDFAVNIDPLRRLRRLPGWGQAYTEALLRRIGDSSGVVYLAKQGQDALGCVAGIMEDQRVDDLLGMIPSKAGRILELVVREAYRGQGIGSVLIEKIENYFRLNGCDIVRVEVFGPNTDAREFYTRALYTDRTIDMVKRL